MDKLPPRAIRQAAAKALRAPIGMTPEQAIFVAALAACSNAAAAAVEAGYKAEDADTEGKKLIRHHHVQTAVDAAYKAKVERILATGDRIISELAKLAFGGSEGKGAAKKDSDRLKALELLGKHHKLWSDAAPVVNLGVSVATLPAGVEAPPKPEQFLAEWAAGQAIDGECDGQNPDE